ncbi:MAG: hypothetical protein KF744_07700 [Taibaiella sp.]|nr:hypothetical protein [Taibaiella sp.]
MKFLKLNWAKVIIRLLIVFAVWAVLNLVGWFGSQNQLTATLWLHERSEMMVTSAAVAILFLTLHIWGYLNHFDSNQSHLIELVNRGIFDSNLYKIGKLHASTWLLFTRECAYGDLGGYPAVVSISTFISQRTETTLEIHFFIEQMNKTQKKTLSIPIINSRLSDNIEREIFAFANTLKNKGYLPGNVTDELHAASLVRWWV